MISNRTIAISVALALFAFLGTYAPAAESRWARASHAPAKAPLAGESQGAAGDPKPIYAGTRIERDGTRRKAAPRLGVILFSPANAHPADKFPVILEYLPYRKDDWALERDYGLYSYFSHFGYVGARVDIRGTGASEGHPPDREFSEQEQLDGMEAIAWLASRPWSNGNVGMQGISWGGFNSIQMAMRHPPALKAIISVDSTDDLFHDDIHYIDGMMHADEFELGMDQELMTTAAPDFPRDEENLKTRFDADPWFPLYLHQQRFGPFWQRASLRPNYDTMQTPALFIGGFCDGYRDVVPRALANIHHAPVKGILGPWNHTFPNDADYGPQVEWRLVAVRWWDRWLKGVRNRIENEPELSVYMRQWYPPNPALKEIPGEWRSEKKWPPADETDRTLYFDGEHALRDAPVALVGKHELRYVPTAGVEDGFWWGELLNDQRPSDAFSLVYDTPPLQSPTAILGLPRVLLQAAASAPLADWIVRLEDVAPDGRVTQVTGAGLNGAQRDSSANPTDLEPGKVYPLTIEMHVTSWVFPPGHRIRVAISNSAWPMIWPTPYAMTTSLVLGGAEGSRLILPVVPMSAGAPPHFDPAVADEALPGVDSHGDTWPGSVTTERDEINHRTRVYWKGDSSSGFPWGHEKYHEDLTYEASDADSSVSSIHGEADTIIDAGDRDIVWRSHLQLKSDAQNFYYEYRRELVVNDRVVRKKSWKETIPRDHQ